MKTVHRLLFLCLSVACLSTPASAEVTYLAELYGEGVHYFFDGDWFQAQEYFDKAISHGYKDPRCYYFRAFLHMYQGCDYQAEQDIQLGARYELEGRGTYDIGRAIYRIQGHQRIKFERLRRDAKLALVESRAIPGLDYQTPTTDGTVLPGVPVTPPGLTDPFTDDDPEPEIPVENVEPEIDSDDMFGDEPMPQDSDLDSNMFDDAPDAGMDDVDSGLDTDTTPPADNADPFADPFGTDDEDPFG